MDQLNTVLNALPDSFLSAQDTAAILGINPTAAGRLLRRWAAWGWVRRIRRGIYAPNLRGAFGGGGGTGDPYSLVDLMFSPAYVGGWSAAELWGLMPSFFRGICIITARPVRVKHLTLPGTSVTLKHLHADQFFDIQRINRGHTQIPVSSPSRTVIDLLDDPGLGGGIRPVFDCLKRYLDQMDNTDDLIKTANKINNGAVYKRMGFLADRAGNRELAALCLQNLTQGNAKLDPALKCERLIKKWRLWVPDHWKERGD